MEKIVSFLGILAGIACFVGGGYALAGNDNSFAVFLLIGMGFVIFMASFSLFRKCPDEKEYVD